MTDKQEALVRTAKPMLYGIVLALGTFFLLKYVSLNVILLGTVIGLTIWFAVYAYHMNLASVRLERQRERERELATIREREKYE